jgi:hypothetical protein
MQPISSRPAWTQCAARSVSRNLCALDALEHDAGGELTTTARHRQSEALKLIHLLRGDLDWIVMKCLEKDRSRRYETANGLAADLKRYLGNEPVVARPPVRPIGSRNWFGGISSPSRRLQASRRCSCLELW